MLNISLNAVIRMSICSRHKQQVLEKFLKALIKGSACFMMHFYVFVVTQLKNRSLAGAILFVRKGQTQEQNLTNKQKSVQKLCIRFFVVKSITVFSESK